MRPFEAYIEKVVEHELRRGGEIINKSTPGGDNAIDEGNWKADSASQSPECYCRMRRVISVPSLPLCEPGASPVAQRYSL